MPFTIGQRMPGYYQPLMAFQQTMSEKERERQIKKAMKEAEQAERAKLGIQLGGVAIGALTGGLGAIGAGGAAAAGVGASIGGAIGESVGGMVAPTPGSAQQAARSLQQAAGTLMDYGQNQEYQDMRILQAQSKMKASELVSELMQGADSAGFSVTPLLTNEQRHNLQDVFRGIEQTNKDLDQGAITWAEHLEELEQYRQNAMSVMGSVQFRQKDPTPQQRWQQSTFIDENGVEKGFDRNGAPKIVREPPSELELKKAQADLDAITQKQDRDGIKAYTDVVKAVAMARGPEDMRPITPDDVSAFVQQAMAFSGKGGGNGAGQVPPMLMAPGLDQAYYDVKLREAQQGPPQSAAAPPPLQPPPNAVTPPQPQPERPQFDMTDAEQMKLVKQAEQHLDQLGDDPAKWPKGLVQSGMSAAYIVSQANKPLEPKIADALYDQLKQDWAGADNIPPEVQKVVANLLKDLGVTD